MYVPLLTSGEPNGEPTDWGKPAGALQFHSGRRRSVVCLVVSARDAGGAQIADFALREGSRPVTVAARRSSLRERGVTVLSGPAAVGDVPVAGPVGG
jgi:hypothetical protein